MAKRLTDTDIWDKEWFMALKPRLKCAVKFIRDKCDLTGVWSPNWILMETYVGEKIREDEVLSIDGGNQFMKLENGKFFCIGFIEFQNGNLPEETAEKISPVHKKILGMMKNNNLQKNEQGYIYPINRVLDRGIVIVRVEDNSNSYGNSKKGVQGEIETAELMPYPTFEDFWNLYDKKIDRPKCELKWGKLNQSEKEAIINYIPQYRASQPDKTYIKHPSTFLQNRSWENEIINSKKNGTKNFTDADLAAAVEKLNAPK